PPALNAGEVRVIDAPSPDAPRSNVMTSAAAIECIVPFDLIPDPRRTAPCSPLRAGRPVERSGGTGLGLLRGRVHRRDDVGEELPRRRVRRVSSRGPLRR